ncbi:MAG: 2-amino-4-hydroxy-6-hydroxymethyldihydropteridine diphosphokinase [Clostridia bacterium]|nr:2-amino-4-hydroxy-6-hydroxymethyldihydropteridine diphosphokinase [Clostridia bacterium]
MDYILLSKMRFFGHTGCFDKEKQDGQYFYVTVKMGVEEIKGAETDNLEDTIDYSVIYDICKETVEGSSCNLIEYLAGGIAERILAADKRILSVSVTVSKPNAPIDGEFDTMAVTVNRQQKHQVYLSLGSNIGDKRENLKMAVNLIESNSEIFEVEVSNVYETEPWGYADQDAFYNICLSLKTSLTPDELLQFTQSIEMSMHRVKTIVNGPRNIDVDILLYDEVKVNKPYLVIPHPRMYERAFVLAPLSELIEIKVTVPSDQGIKKIGKL